MRESVFYSEYFYQKGSKDTEVLEKNANENPLSSLAAFLLLYHYKKISHPGFETLAKKTALLFDSPHWLQFQLHDDDFQKPEQQVIEESVPEEIEKPAEFANQLPGEVSAQQIFSEEIEAAIADVKENTGENESVYETVYEANEIPEPQTNYEGKDELAQDGVAELHVDTIDEEILPQPEPAVEKTADTNQDSPIIDPEEMSAEDNTSESETEPVPLEPLHTVDYFASQGIKITDDPISNDKLGSQMRSFTEWLKMMKKIHPANLEEQNTVSERLIQTSAEASNINTDILTEAMAEVLVKQDKKEKAIEMFSKLSLINPAKSAYFAARIESIKSS